MAVIADIFSSDSFTATSLTRAINIVPNDYGRMRELNLFPAEMIATTTVTIEYNQGQLNILPTRVRGAPPSLGTPERRSGRQFACFHIPHDDFVTADEVQNILARLGEGNALAGVEERVNRKLIRMRAKHAVTLEHLRMTALRGTILDNDGSTLLNLYNEFGITQKSVDFVLGTAGTDVKAKAREVVAYMEDNLQGETMSSLHVLASPEWFEKFISHASVLESYKAYDGPQNPLRNDVRRRFPFHGLTIEEYRGTASYLQEDGTYGTRRYIPAGEALAFPLGTTDMFSTYFAPADFIDTVNTLGEEIYVRQARDLEFNRWVKLHTQSNPLPLNKRPALVVRLHTSN